MRILFSILVAGATLLHLYRDNELPQLLKMETLVRLLRRTD
jgi:hypothetical protein